jgi:hypothetical protein
LVDGFPNRLVSVGRAQESSDCLPRIDGRSPGTKPI